MSNAWDLRRATIARHGADHPSFKHGTFLGNLWFGALFWTRLVSFGSELSSFLLGLFILSHSQMTRGVWTINQISSFTPKTWSSLKKNCSPIDEQWEESSPFGWYIVIHQPEIKDMFGWFPFATNVMTSWWGHCNSNHDQWTEKDTGWYGYGSIPINTIFRGMSIHLPAILMFTRGTRFSTHIH